MGGWTFEEFDRTPAIAIYETMEIWRLQDEERERKARSRK